MDPAGAEAGRTCGRPDVAAPVAGGGGSRLAAGRRGLGGGGACRRYGVAGPDRSAGRRAVRRTLAGTAARCARAGSRRQHGAAVRRRLDPDPAFATRAHRAEGGRDRSRHAGRRLVPATDHRRLDSRCGGSCRDPALAGAAPRPAPARSGRRGNASRAWRAAPDRTARADRAARLHGFARALRIQPRRAGAHRIADRVDAGIRADASERRTGAAGRATGASDGQRRGVDRLVAARPGDAVPGYRGRDACDAPAPPTGTDRRPSTAGARRRAGAGVGPGPPRTARLARNIRGNRRLCRLADRQAECHGRAGRGRERQLSRAQHDRARRGRGAPAALRRQSEPGELRPAARAATWSHN